MLRANARVYLAGGGGEPAAVMDAWAGGGLPPGLCFTGVWLPGINRRDPSALAPDATAETFFVGPDLRAGFAAGRVRFLPLHYSRIFQRLATSPLDVAVVCVAPPDADGMCSLGIAADFTPAVLRPGVRLIGQLNPAMPRTSAPAIALSRFDAVMEAETPLPTLPVGPLGDAFRRIAGHIAELVRPGDTLQLGLGKVQQAVLGALAGHRDLGLHAGMISDPVQPLVEAGVLARGVVCGVAAGSAGFYRWLGTRPDIVFRSTGHTHALPVLAGIGNLLAVNSVLEVDLFGQANGEMLDGRQISGHGGLVDFVRGAAAAPGGRSILALPAATEDGRTRIHPALPAHAIRSTLRADADMVATEHGVAHLRDQDIDGRAQALIAIADPRCRDALADGWAALRRRM